jgi:ABC-type taurine transport system ATPase subunit
MKKRAALARALVMEPELLFLDEPTSGLDPISAREFDHLLRVLCDSLGLTALMLLIVIGGVNTGYALLAARARRFFANEPAQRAILRVAGTLMFVAAALVATRV